MIADNANPPLAASQFDSASKSTRAPITLAHGGGGLLTDALISETILPHIGNSALNDLLDSASVHAGNERLAMTIDSYVVQPLFFPGGDIGRLCISGTVNDLVVSGAVPHAIALSLILGEGLSRDTLDRVMQSISETAREANVRIVTGDTKVIERGSGETLLITTSGIGRKRPQVRLHPDEVRPGDLILINGFIADHGLSVLLAREMPQVKSAIRSDVAPLCELIAEVFAASRDIAFMRDPTRGGVAGVVADLAQRTGLHITLEESEIPVRPETLHAAEMLGLDPLEVANEGKVVIIVRPEAADKVLRALNQHPLGKDAAIIGKVENARDGLCEIHTSIGGRRILQKPYGEQLPRIC
jgi:hydrogenase expression/formation protein HypE